jgi:general secretion pathway protein F
MSYVVPKVTQIFLDLDQALPIPTILLINISHFFQEYWWVLLLAPVLILYALRRYSRSKKGKVLYDRMLLAIPFIGLIIKNISISRFARTLGTLLKNEVPLLTALNIVRTVVANEILSKAVENIRLQVSEGQSLVQPMSKSQIFPSAVVQMTAAGEQSGNLAEMLIMVADNFESEVTNRLTVVTSLMEPIMILVLGSMVGFVVLAVLLPIFEMSHLVQ